MDLRAIMVGLLLPAASLASDWQSVTLSKSGVLVLLDVTSVTTNQGIRKAWIQYFLPKAGPLPSFATHVDNTASTLYQLQKDLIYTNCSEHTIAHVRSLYYDSAESLIGSFSLSARDVEFFDPVPDTLDQTVLQRVCNLQIK